MKIFQYGGRHRAIGTMWPVTLPTEANENTWVARGTLSAITVGSSNLCTGPKFRAAAPNIVADKNFSVVLDLLTAISAIKMHSHWRVWTRTAGPALNVRTWIKRKYSHWRVRTCGPAEKPAKCHAVISRTRKFSLACSWRFGGLKVKFPIR